MLQTAGIPLSPVCGVEPTVPPVWPPSGVWGAFGSSSAIAYVENLSVWNVSVLSAFSTVVSRSATPL